MKLLSSTLNLTLTVLLDLDLNLNLNLIAVSNLSKSHFVSAYYSQCVPRRLTRNLNLKSKSESQYA